MGAVLVLSYVLLWEKRRSAIFFLSFDLMQIMDVERAHNNSKHNSKEQEIEIHDGTH